MPSTPLQMRRQRARHIRRRVVGVATAIFLASTGGIFVQLVSGHDPALARSTTSTGTTTSTAAVATGTPSAATSSNSSSSGSSGSSTSAGSSASGSATPVTTSAS